MQSAKRWFIGLILSAVCALAVPAHAQLSDDFNTENGGTPALNYFPFTNWMVLGGAVDLIGTGAGGSAFEFFGGAHGLYVDLNGSVGLAGLFETKMVFDPGTYEIKAKVAGNQRGGAPDQVRMQFGSFFDVFVELSPDPFVERTWCVTVREKSQLSFLNTNVGGTADTDNIGALLDDVSVMPSSDPLCNPIPEPSTCALLALGVAPLLRRRRRA